MNSVEFHKHAAEVIDFICKYQETVEQRCVIPNVEPGFLRPLIPEEPPQNPESFTTIMKDFETKIMPGMAHWTHPQFHAYFPSGTSYPCVLAEILIGALNINPFSWVTSPACTELETIVLEMMGKLYGLPEALYSQKGGGVTQSGASECILIAMLGARARAVNSLKMQYPTKDDGLLLSKLIAYCTKEAHSCVEKAAKIAFVKIRIMETDQTGEMNIDKLVELMQEDEADGLVPFFVSTTIGTTASTAIDPIAKVAKVLKGFPNVWLHVDGAYGGSALVCPELRQLFKGLEYADSFNTNPQKWLLTSVECSLLYFRDASYITSALVVNPVYLDLTKDDDPQAIDYRNWSISLSRRFRALKLWFVVRSYGKKGLQAHIRNHVKLAKYFEGLVGEDDRFEICNNVRLGLVCIRVIGSEPLNEQLLRNINASGLLHMVPAKVAGRYLIRFCLSTENLTEAHVDKAWGIIQRFTTELRHQREELNKFIDKMGREKLAAAFPYLIRVASSPREDESAILEPHEKDPSGKKHERPRSVRRESWVSLPLWPVFKEE